LAESPGATEAVVPALREQAADALTRLQAELGDAIVEHPVERVAGEQLDR